MANLPTGTVTFLFTDIESSTTLWEQHRDAMRQALIWHDALIEQIVAEHQGQVVPALQARLTTLTVGLVMVGTGSPAALVRRHWRRFVPGRNRMLSLFGAMDVIRPPPRLQATTLSRFCHAQSVGFCH